MTVGRTDQRAPERVDGVCLQCGVNQHALQRCLVDELHPTMLYILDPYVRMPVMYNLYNYPLQLP